MVSFGLIPRHTHTAHFFFQKTNKAGKIRYQLMVKCLLKRDEMLVTLLNSDQQLLSETGYSDKFGFAHA